MGQRVIPVEVGVRWDPNTEHAVLASWESGVARLRMRAHFDDPDQRVVVLVWEGVYSTRMEGPNDEAGGGHRLYGIGLREVQWMGEVLDSELIAELEMRNRVHERHDPNRFAGYRHWVVALKGKTVEVVARSLEATRLPVNPPDQ